MNGPFSRRFRDAFRSPLRTRSVDAEMRRLLTDAPSYRALEQRIAFDAAAVVTADEVVRDQSGPAAADAGYVPEQAAADAALAEAAGARSSPQTAQVIVFVDSAVSDISSYLSGLDASAEIVLLQPDSDGVEQIAAALAGHSDIDAIHIISHGSEGQIQLGNATLSAVSMQGEHLDELATIGAALAADGDILIYGCDFTGGEAGLEAAMILGGITGADIAASIDATGSSDLGGDWDLETAIGGIDAASLNGGDWAGKLAAGDILLPDEGGNDDQAQDSSDFTAVTVDYANIASGQLVASVQVDPTANSGSNTSNIALVFDTDGDGNANYGFAITLGGAPTFSVQQFSLFYGKGDGFNDKISGAQTTIGQWISGSGWQTGNYLSALQTTYTVDTAAQDPFDTTQDTRVTLTVNLNDILAHWQSLGNTSATFADIKLVNVTMQPSHSASSAPKDVAIETAGPYVAVGDSASTNEDSSVVINVAANDSTALSDSSVAVATQPTNGTAVANGDGTITYTPNADFVGTDTFTYEIYGIDGVARTATVSVSVAPVDDLPVAVADNYTTDEDTQISGNVSTNDTGLGDGGLVYTVVAGPATGTLVLNANGTFTYTPASNVTGTVTFTYRVQDADGDTSTAIATIVIDPVNDDPTAVDDSYTVGEDSGATTFDVLGNDLIAPDSGETLTITGVTQPANGTVTFTATDVTFTPAADFSGTTTFSYTVSDGTGGSATATVTVGVDPVNDDPTAVDDIAGTVPGQPVAIDVLSNDHDINGDPLSVIAATSNDGSVSIASDGTVVFTPNPGFEGVAVITYVVSDGQGGTDIGTVRVSVTPLLVTFLPDIDVEPLVSTLSPLEPVGIAVLPVVVDAINEVSFLGGISGQLSSEGIVVAAANGMSHLDGIARFSDRMPTVAKLLDKGQILKLLDGAFTTGGLPFDQSWDVSGLKGFSLKFNLGDGGSSSGERLVLESLVRQETLVLRVTTEDVGHVEGDVEYKFQLADGRPLPAWLDRVGHDLVVGRHPPSVESVDLKVMAIFPDGRTITRFVTIQANTGEIQPMKDRRAEISPPLFLDDVRKRIDDQGSEVRQLYRALGGR